MRIAVCWKWVSLDRERDTDERWAGVSPADEAALEVALALADRARSTASTRGTSEVVVVTLGPDGADTVLRDAGAVGADRVVRIAASTELDGRVVADAIARQVDGVDLVLCGDYSLDRGTGSVPAFLAGELGAAQALGLVEVDVDAFSDTSDDTALRVVRRLDGGRREVLDVGLPAVLSVEGSVATLRRAPMAAQLAARSIEIPVVAGPHGRLPETEVHPYRPRPRSLDAPTGGLLSRVRTILDVGGEDHHAEPVELDPPAAARRIVEQLRDWGYVDVARDGRDG